MSSGGSKKSGPKTIKSERTSISNPISYYKGKAGVYPSNAEMWWAYRRPVEVGTDKPPKGYLEVFDPSLRHQISMGNTPAPKGHFILQAFYIDRSYLSNVPGLPVQTAGKHRPSCVAFFGGRVFYAGVQTIGFNTKIYFSQVLERAEQVQECYQSADPTNEDIRDLLPTDGGVIVIPEITEVYYLHPMGQSLYVFARNGVWGITGSEGIGFRANDYSVQKISSTPAVSPLSFVDVEGAPLWWNRSGIWTLTADQLGNGQVRSLSDETIKQFFDTIPTDSKLFAKGAYDPLLGRVQWLYRSTETDNPAEQYIYDSILNLDTKSGAFYVFDMNPGDRVDVRGIFDVEGYQIDQETQQVLVDEDVVFVDAEEVGYILEIKYPVQSRFVYIVDVKEETLGIPETPEPAPAVTHDVFSAGDLVEVDVDTVQVTI